MRTRSLDRFFPFVLALVAILACGQATAAEIREFPVPSGSHPHDVAPAPDGSVWYTAQRTGELGKLEPATGRTRHIPLGKGSSPHGVIVGPDGAPWITDSGLNAIVRVDPKTEEVRIYPLRLSRFYACRALPRMSASSSAGRARCGAPSRAWTSWS